MPLTQLVLGLAQQKMQCHSQCVFHICFRFADIRSTQFFVQESQGNQEILKIFDDTNFVSLNGTADFSLQKAICTLSEQKEFPKDRILPGNPDLQEAFIRLSFEPGTNSGSGLLLKKGEQNGTKHPRFHMLSEISAQGLANASVNAVR